MPKPNKHSIANLLLSAALFFAGCAAPAPNETAGRLADGFVPVECPAGRHPLLWRVPTPNGQVFLLGSIHMGHPSFYPFPDAIEDAFERSSRLVVEVDITSAENERQMNAFLLTPRSEGDPSLREMLSPEEYARLARFAAGYGVPLEAFEPLNPGLAGMTLSTLPFMAAGFDPNSGVDKYFLDRSSDIEVAELETLAAQLELIGSFDDAFLQSMLDSLDYAEEDVTALHRAWKCGDEGGLVHLMQTVPRERSDGSAQSLRALADFNAAFLDDRNARMAEAIAALFQRSGDSFVVVGAAHLVGDRGIPALLRAAGYEVDVVAP